MLDNNSCVAWSFPLLEPQGDAPRHCAQGRQARYQITQQPGRDLVADCCERRFKQDVRGQEAFGARALHRQLSHDLRPAVTLLSQQRVVRDCDTVEDHLAEMALSSDLSNYGIVNAGRCKSYPYWLKHNEAFILSS